MPPASNIPAAFAPELGRPFRHDYSLFAVSNFAEIPPFSWLDEQAPINPETSMNLHPVTGLKLLYDDTGLAA